MIDIHSHILPGIDDGAATVDEAIQMAKQAVAAGVTSMFATPHVLSGQELRRTPVIERHVAFLQEELNKRSIPLQLIAGAELYPLDGLLTALAEGLPITLGKAGRHLLLEMPLSAIPMGIEQLIYALQTRGVTPILAHPERCIPVQQNPGVLEPMLERGVLVQITASSLQEKHSEIARKTANSLLRHNWVHFVASDAHSPRYRRSNINEVTGLLTEQYGQEMVEALVTLNGQRVIDGEAVPTDPLPFVPQAKRRWWNIFRR